MNTNKVRYVTGASQGLGLSLIKQLLSAGYRVAASTSPPWPAFSPATPSCLSKARSPTINPSSVPRPVWKALSLSADFDRHP